MNREDCYQRNLTIKDLASQGYTLQEIADKMKMKPMRIRQILRSYKIKPFKATNANNGEIAKSILQKLAEGKRQCDIARELGVSRQYVFEVKQREEVRLEAERIKRELMGL